MAQAAQCYQGANTLFLYILPFPHPTQISVKGEKQAALTLAIPSHLGLSP